MSKFDKSLFGDQRVARDDFENSAPEQLRIALDDLERVAVTVLDREGISVAKATTMAANTPTGRAGRIAAGVQAVRRTLVNPEATAAALATYWLMQQFAAGAVDEWREEVRGGVAAVERQRKAAGSSKRREAYDAVANYCVTTMGPALAPRLVWKFLKEKKRDVGGRVVQVDDGNIRCTGNAPITRDVFLKTYLKPAREAAAKS